ncbi:hypothetical protein GCM10009854_29380 [Saccharopolyspora halophila]|uniref:Excalibur calcium-binding domain-containing protein n=1 Tax=Saccharopolyspora halophila TaxID=405551 RepID=A0ABP5TCP4_9PSEU
MPSLRYAVLCTATIALVAGGCTIEFPTTVTAPPEPPAPSAPPPAAAPQPPPAAPQAPPAAAPRAAPSPATHDCQVLQGRGMTYSEVLGYWSSLGLPQDMDDDRDGWPCETIYGDQNPGLSTAQPGLTTHDCQVLQGRGMTYSEVLGYWSSLGLPQDMDDDRDGWPCETIYGDQN